MTCKNFSSKCLVAAIAAMLAWTNPSQAQSFTQDFEDLLERCRLSVETSSAFNTEGLEMRDVGAAQARSWGTDTEHEAWAPPGSDLYAVLTVWRARDGKKRHLCTVALADEEYVLSQAEQGLLLRHFLVRAAELLGAGTHVVDAQLSPIPPIVNSAFLKIDKNPNGCIVSNSLALLADGTFFSARVGEQAIRPCVAN